MTFEDAVATHMAMLDTTGSDTSEGGRGNAFTRWYMWADNRRSICPVGEDIFAPLGRELMHYLTTPTGYCAAMSPYTPNWKCIGPYNNYYGSGVQDHAGRINCVWANPNNIAHMRAGANSGGLWETRDTGHTWRCITDRVTTGAYGTQIPGTVAVSAMAVSPLDTNEIHLRLSTIATSGKSNGYDMGIIHSFDGGQHWYHDAVFRSILDPLAFPDFLEGATVGMKFVPGSSKIYSIKNNKIFFNDGTGIWSIKSPGSGTDIKRVTDIEYSRTTPNVALFSADDHDQELHVYSYNYVTDDWAEYDVVVPSPHDTVNWDYISDMSVSTGDTVFMLLHGTGSVEHGYLVKMPLSTGVVYFLEMDPQNTVPVVQPFQYIEVSPNNTRVLYCTNHDGQNNFFKSTNFGETFFDVKGSTHADGRDIQIYAPASYLDDNGDFLIGATDGGVEIKKSGELDFRSITGDSLCVQEFYGLALCDVDDGIIHGGTHDNGGFTFIQNRSPQWKKETTLGGDNYLSAFARKGVKTVYTEQNFPELRAASISGSSVSFPTLNHPNDAVSGSFSPLNNYQRPICFDENNKAYIGYRGVWKKGLSDASWEAAFFDVHPILRPNNPMVSDIVIADNSNLDTVYVAYRGAGDWALSTSHTFNKKLFRSFYASTFTPGWEQIMPRSLGVARINDIEVAHDNAARMWVAFGNILYTATTIDPDDMTDRVLYTTDYGTTWIDVSKGLPNFPVNKIIVDKANRNILYAATDIGVYRCDFSTLDPATFYNPHPSDLTYFRTSSVEWKCFNSGMPACIVVDIDINYCSRKLRAATYGRGIWETTIPNDGTDQADEIVISSNTTWNKDRIVYGNVRIKPGSTLRISRTKIYMPHNGVIRVEPGGRLIVDSSTLTNSCDGSMWGGIQAWGNSSASQDATHQGWVVIKNNSVVEHAVTGVTNYNPDPIYYPHGSGGIVQVLSSTFRNNRTAVSFEEYHNMSGAIVVPNLSYFFLSRFELNGDYKNIAGAAAPSKMVQLQGVEGVDFRGCSFLEKRFPYSGFVDGIQATNSGFNVVPFCAVTGPAGCAGAETRCRFKGLRNGVYTRASAPGLAVGTVTIDRADFDTSTVGVQISVHEGVSVTRCVFRIGRGIVNTFMESSAGLPASCGRNIGVLTQSSKIYRVEGNTFSGVTNSFGVSPWHNIGVLAINSGNYTNRIYRNSFDHLTYGVLGLGDNRTSYPAYSGYGLQVSCNTFNTNTNDIYSGGSYDYEGIGLQQRGPTYYTSASNSFSGSTKNIVNPNYNRPLQYFNHSGTPTLSGNATLHSGVLDACPATIPTPSGSVTAYPSYMTATTSSLDLTSLAGYKAAYYTQRAEYQNALAEMAETIDRGNTDSVVNFIDTSSDYTSMFNALSKISPYLSATALRKVAEVASQTNYEDVVALLAENPEVIADYNELNDLADIAGMTAQDFTDLWAVACSTLTGRTTLEGAARSAGAAMDETAGMVLMALKSPIDTNVAVTDTTFAGVCLDTNSVYYLNDSNSFYHSIDSVDSWLATIGKTEMQYERLGIKYLKGEYNSIISSFNAIDTQYLDSAGMVAHRYMKTYLEVLLDAHASGRSIYQLSDTDMQLLSLDAYPALDIRASRVFAGNAKTDPISHFPCAAAPPVSKFPRRIKDRTKENTPVYRVSAYPNPSKGDVSFECITPANNTEGVRLTVMNLLGETVFDYTMPAKSGSYDWNTGALSSGVYIYVASVNNRIVGKGKVVLVK